VTGRVAITRALLPALRRGRERVINIGAVSGRATAPFFGPPAVASAAFAALSDAMRMEFAPFGVLVSPIEPGAIRTEIFNKLARTFDGDLLEQPKHLAQAYRPAILAAREARSRSGADVPRVVVEAIMSALNARGRPPARTLVGKGSAKIAMVGLLPTGLRDNLLMSLLGLSKPMAAVAQSLGARA